MGENNYDAQSGEEKVAEVIEKTRHCLERAMEDLDNGYLHAAFLDMSRVAKNAKDACAFLRMADGLKEETTILVRA